MSSRPADLVLLKPIELGDFGTFRELRFRPLQPADFLLLEKAMTFEDLDDFVRMVASFAEIPFCIAELIEPEDTVALIAAISEHVEKHIPMMEALYGNAHLKS